MVRLKHCKLDIIENPPIFQSTAVYVYTFEAWLFPASGNQLTSLRKLLSRLNVTHPNFKFYSQGKTYADAFIWVQSATSGLKICDLSSDEDVRIP